MQEVTKKITIISKESPKTKVKQFLFRAVMVADQMNRIEKEIQNIKRSDIRVYKQSKKIWVGSLNDLEKRLNNIQEDLKRFTKEITDEEIRIKAKECLQLTNESAERVTECLHNLSSV